MHKVFETGRCTRCSKEEILMDGLCRDCTFGQLIKEWVGYCNTSSVQYDSSASSVIACESYKGILMMGKSSLPLIRKLYDEDSSDNYGLAIVQAHGLVCLTLEIMGEKFLLPEDIKGNILAIMEYTKKGLDEYFLETGEKWTS